MTRRVSLTNKIALLLLCLLAIELGFVAYLKGQLDIRESRLAKVRQAQKAIDLVSEIAGRLSDMSLAVNMDLQGHIPKDTSGYERDSASIKLNLAQLKEIVRGNPDQLNEAQLLEASILDGLKIVGEAYRTYIAGEWKEHRRIRYRIYRFSDNATQKIERLLSLLKEVEKQSPRESESAIQQVYSTMIAGFLSQVFAACGLAFLFVRGVSDRVKRVEANCLSLATGGALAPAQPVGDEIGELDALIHNLSQSLAEEAHKETALVDAATDIICSIDADGTFTAVNKACLEKWGYSQEELLGRRVASLLPESDRTSVSEAIKQSIKKGGAMEFESRVTTAAGALLCMLWSVVWSKRQNSLFCVLHDITELKQAERLLKQSEERTRAVIDRLPLGLITTDSQGKILSSNPTFARMFLAKEDPSGKTELSHLLHSKDAAAAILDAAAKSPETSPVQVEAVKFDSTRFPALVSINWFLTQRLERYLASFEDLTGKLEAQRLKREFVAMVSHDLRTPLTSIKATLSLVSQGVYGSLSDAGQNRMTKAFDESERLIKLVNELLELERLDEGKLTLSVNETRLTRLIDRAVESVHGIAQRKGVEIVKQVEDCALMIDEDRMIQVLVNLLSNAIKFTEDQQKSKVTISAASTGDNVEISVIDKGRGIPDDKQAMIFQRFKQAEIADGQYQKGTGLGLSIARAIVELHGGTIEVTSTVGDGSTFSIVIPSHALE